MNATRKNSTRKKSSKSGKPPVRRASAIGDVGFGLVTLPIKAYAAARPAKRAREEHPSCRLSVVAFVPFAALDVTLIRSTHYVVPGPGGDRAYALLALVAERAQRMAIGCFQLRGRACLVALRPHRGGLLMHRLFEPDELRPELEVPGTTEFRDVEVDLATKLVEQLSVDTFDIAAYAPLRIPPREPKPSNVIDLFLWLKGKLEPEARCRREPESANDQGGAL